MYPTNINNLPVYDETTIEKIKEIIKQGFDKLKKFVKSKLESKFKIYHELDAKFNEIAEKLEKYEILNNELNYFISIKEKVLYIIFKNCENNSFGHCDFALNLYDLFIEIWNLKIKYLKNQLNANEYETHQKDIKTRYGKCIREYYLDIDETPCEFSDDEMYKIHKSLSH